MIVDLDKRALVALVKGVVPNYNVFNHPLVKHCGGYVGGFVDNWHWNNNLQELPEKDLWKLYTICRNSWPK